MPKLNTLQDVYVDSLRSLYNAENQILKALPRMAKAVTNEELRAAFLEHVEQTEVHIERLGQVFEMLDMKVRGKKCIAMEGLIDEGKEMMSENIDDNALDAVLIACAQKVEHFEIAAYGTARTWASELGFSEQAQLLEQTLEEEKMADEHLTMIAEAVVNIQAESVGESPYTANSNGASSNGRAH